jgi:hypothetical protein
MQSKRVWISKRLLDGWDTRTAVSWQQKRMAICETSILQQWHNE